MVSATSASAADAAAAAATAARAGEDSALAFIDQLRIHGTVRAARESRAGL
jgi:hypothetical protein